LYCLVHHRWRGVRRCGSATARGQTTLSDPPFLWTKTAPTPIHDKRRGRLLSPRILPLFRWGFIQAGPVDDYGSRSRAASPPCTPPPLSSSTSHKSLVCHDGVVFRRTTKSPRRPPWCRRPPSGITAPWSVSHHSALVRPRSSLPEGRAAKKRPARQRRVRS
jgi:hypothetical protein